MAINSQKEGAVAVTVDGVLIPGPWQVLEGDEVTADVEKIFPGHMEPAIPKAGSPEHADVTVRRTYDTDKFSAGLYDWLKGKVSAGEGQISRMILNSNKSVAETTPLIGLLVGTSRSDYDSSSGAVTQVSLTFSIQGP